MAETAELVEEKKAIRRIMDKLAPIYETKVWAPSIWRLFGGLCAPSYWRMAEIVAEKTEIREGCSALDVATGSGVTARKLSKLAGEGGYAIPNPERSLREMSKVLKANGKISMITASMPSFLPEWIKQSSLTRNRHLHHQRFETEELREMLKQNELMDTKAESYGAFLLVEARKIKPTTSSYISAST